MTTVAWLFMLSTLWLQRDTEVVLGVVERDLTGDGRPEILRVVGVGPTRNKLELTFTIESEGKGVYRSRLEPFVPDRARVEEFRRWFFAREKFQRPAEFVDTLRAMSRTGVADIPNAIARDRLPSETRDGGEIWKEILNSPVTIFTFSPGGDAIVAIGWSARAGRFYRLLECC